MRPKAPKILRGQAETFAAATEAVVRWFRRPDPAALSGAHAARLHARGWRGAAVAALKGARGPAKSDAADLSFALREAVEQVVMAASEAARWGVAPDREFALIAEALRDGAQALSRAASADSEERAAALVESKRWASEAERRRRELRAREHESPDFVESIKHEQVAVRLSAAAEALHQACDALAGSLAE